MTNPFGQDYADWNGWNADTFGITSPADASYFKKQMSVTGVNARTSRVLEVGFGNGSFLSWARTEGWDIHGHEVNEGLLQLARDKGFNVFNSEHLEVQSCGQFDLIIAFDVTEHIPRLEVENWIRSLRELLAEEGELLLRFPNGDSPLSMPIQNGDTTHLHAIGAKMIRQIFHSTGLSVVQIAGQARPLRTGSYARSALNLVSRPLLWFIDIVHSQILLGGRESHFSSFNLVAVGRKHSH